MPENHDHSNGVDSTERIRSGQDQGPSDNAREELEWPAADTPPAESATEQTGKIQMPAGQGAPPSQACPVAKQRARHAANPALPAQQAEHRNTSACGVMPAGVAKA